MADYFDQFEEVTNEDDYFAQFETVESQPQVGVGEAGWEGFKRGSTLGFGDELSAASTAVGVKVSDFIDDLITTDEERRRNEMLGEKFPEHRESFYDIYEREKRRHRKEYEQAREQHPVATGAGEVGGMALTSVIPGAGATKVAPMVGGGIKTAAALEGATTMGTYGAGTSEGDISERLKQAAKYGTAGAVLGPVATKVGEVALPSLKTGTKKLYEKALTAEEKQLAKLPGSLGDEGAELVPGVSGSLKEIIGAGYKGVKAATKKNISNLTMSDFITGAIGYTYGGLTGAITAVGVKSGVTEAGKIAIPTAAAKSYGGIANVTKSISKTLDKWGPELQRVAARGANAITAYVHTKSQQDPVFRETINQIKKETQEKFNLSQEVGQK